MAKSTFRLSDFKAAIKANGVARNTRFEITLHPPTKVISDVDARELSIRCNSGSTPPMNIKTKDFYVGQGQMRKMPVGYDQGNAAQFTFYNDNKSVVYRDLLIWSKAVLASQDENRYEVNYYSEYTGYIEVKQLDEQDNIILHYTLFESYPVAVDAVALDSADQNTAQVIKVTFAYRYARTKEEQQRLNPWDTVTKVVGNGVPVVPFTDPMDITDPTMYNVARREKGHSATFDERYAATYQMCTATNTMGNQVLNEQGVWQSASSSVNGAINTGDGGIISNVWNSVKNTYNSIANKATEFFGKSAEVNKEYKSIAPSLPTTDPLHGEMGVLQNTYKTASSNQAKINYDYSNLSAKVDTVLTPSPGNIINI